MKKKAIERIPYLTAQKCSNKSMKYVAAVVIKVIDHKQHLLLEIFENKKKSLNVPVIRFAYTKSDWGNYDPKTGAWSASSIEGGEWSSRCDINYRKTYISERDKEKIKRFTKHSVPNKEDWPRYLILLESDIKNARYQRRSEKRRERLQERCAAVGELPDDFEDWYKSELFAGENYIYYKRKGRYATCWCSHCGKSYTHATQALDTYEGQFERIMETPRRGGVARCELCDAQGYYKTAGTMKDVYRLKRMCYVGQRYKDTGLVSRYIQVEKILQIGEPERFVVVEVARSFFEKGKNRIRDYHLYNPWIGENEWCDHNIGGLGAQVHEGAAYIYPGTYDALRETDFKYCALEQYMQDYDKIEMPEYLELYEKHERVEMLVKMGMHKLVTKLLTNPWCRSKYIKNKNAANLEDAFGINRAHKKLFINSGGEARLLSVLQQERELNATWTDEQCEHLSILAPDQKKLELAIKYMTVQQFLNRVERYSGVELSEGLCGRAFGMAVHASTTYLDYISMRIQHGYDMTNTIYLYPRELEVAHQSMVLESQQKELDKRKAEVKEKYPDIKRRYRGLRKKYYFENQDMVIRPAKSAEEIVIEGRVLHHCVGSDSYLRKHNRGDSTILFLRFKKTCNTPYITVEIENNRITQWYGAYDKKPDEENMQQWLDAYVAQLKQKEQQETVAVQIPVQVAG